MELTPVFSKFLSNGGDMELTELSTRLSAQPGQTLVIGGTDTGEDNVSTALFGYSRLGDLKFFAESDGRYIQLFRCAYDFHHRPSGFDRL